MNKILIFITMVAGVILVGFNSAKAETEIRYGGQYYPEEFLLQGKPDLWEMFGLNAEHILFSSGTENNQALISGRIDVNCGSDSKTVGLFGTMEDKAVVIGITQKGDRYSTVVRKGSGIANWEDLKGQTVATRLGSGAEQVLRRYFDEQPDLAWDDFRWVNLKIEDMISSLEAGNIAAFTVWEPTSAIAEAQGIGEVMRTYGDISQVPVSLHTTQKFIQDNRELVVKFLAAHLAKADLIKNDPETAAKYAAQAAGARGHDVSPEVFLRVFERIDFDLDITPEVVESIESTATFLHSENKIQSVPEIYYDQSLLDEARELYNRTVVK